jgi:DNA-binding transcriptional ArsR family regulator
MARCYTDEDRLKKIRDFFIKEGRVPKEREFRDGFSQIVRERFGSWGKAVRLATGQSAERHYWTDEELVAVLKNLHERTGKFPRWDELKSIKKSLPETIRTRFGGLDEALEHALGTSPRLEVLRALAVLTPPGCDRATSSEIRELIGEWKSSLTVLEIGHALNRLRERGFADGGQMGQRAYWSMNSRGRLLLKAQTSLRRRPDTRSK